MRHTGKQAYKDRRLKLPEHVTPVFDSYVQHGITDVLFPSTQRFIRWCWLMWASMPRYQGK